MGVWLLSSGKDKFRLDDYLKKYGYVDWSQSKDLKINDIVLIYISLPVGQVRYMMEVSDIDLTFEQTTDNVDFWIDNKIYEKGKKKNRYCRLVLKKELLDDDRLTYYALSHNGLGNVQGIQKLEGEKLEYFTLFVMKELLLDQLIIAINQLYEKDSRNLSFEVSERNLCGRLAFYLENLMRKYDLDNKSSFFKEYFADIEYNRMESLDGKPIKKSITYENGEKDTIICDLLVHSRGTNKKQDNLIALEMKRTYNKDSVESDNKRLMTLVSPPQSDAECKSMYNTLLGVFLTCDKNNCKMNVYEFNPKMNNYILCMKDVEIIKK